MSKTLDHRSGKTYDIKPVNKRGDVDVEKIESGDSLVRFADTKRERRAAHIFKRFEEEKQKALQQRSVFDFDLVRKEVEMELADKGLNETEDVNEAEVAPIQTINNLELYKEHFYEEQRGEGTEDIEQNEKIKEKKDNIDSVSDLRVDKIESPEEVLKKFRESFVEKKKQKKDIITEDENRQEQQKKQDKMVLEEYRVFQGNQMLNPKDTPELQIAKIETFKTIRYLEEEKQENKQEKVEEEEKTQLVTEPFIEVDTPSVEIVKEQKQEPEAVSDGRILTSEMFEPLTDGVEEVTVAEKEVISKTALADNWMSEKEEQGEIVAEKRKVEDELRIKASLIEKNRKEAEAKKEAKKEREQRMELARKQRAEESRLFWQKRQQEAEIQKETEKVLLEAEIEEDEIEKKIQQKSKFNEPIIETKLNAWFDCGIVEPTIADEKAIIETKKQESFIQKAKQSKKEKKETIFTEKASSAERVSQEKKKGKGFLSLNYRKNGEKFHWSKLVAKPMLSFVATSFAAFFIVGSIIFISYGFQVQENVKVKGQQALGYLDQAKSQIKGQDFLSAKSSFASAVREFEEAQKELDRIGGDMLNVFSTLPILSRISSGKNVVDAGNELTKAAEELSGAIEVLASLENPFSFEEGEEGDRSQKSMLDMFIMMQNKLKVADKSLKKAENALNLVKISDLPPEYQDKFQKIKDTLPMILSMIDVFEQNSEIFLELLGHNGPRKYLLIFQNNQEMRATGGFIGSYGILHISNGRIKKLLIEGIYNPDGQLKHNIVPPKPIQKISAGWSTHDANWFPHFPTTAEKIAMFYEYTGGPTVDGIITMTPVVLQKMLAITGPIEMEEYGTVITSENFIRETQYEVEVDYDKSENKPKQFLADLAPKIITSLFESEDPGDASKILEMFSETLKERHIMVHSFSDDVQSVVSDRGWSGEILKTEKDYLMVINSNINGFKTDGVVDETITHSAKISEDGTITNTIKIKREHNGGDTEYEWWNKVNSDYMRVYVPKGSKLISVKGQTREINEPPLDYDKLGFKRDEDVVKEEAGIELDEETGTRIYEEEGKTVFANWVYVSPKETVEVEYEYELPFKLDLKKNEQVTDTYSLLVQKQSGSVGSSFSSTVEYDLDAKPVWMHPQDIKRRGQSLRVEAKLATDLFFGAVFQGEKTLEEDKK